LKILAVETSGDYCSVALWRDARLDAREMPAGQRQSGLVLDMVHGLLDACGIAPRDLDGIAYGAGPGSFTGLRIACGVVQGMALGANKPVAGVGTLLALAQACGAARVVCCIDARMHEVYHAAYEKRGDAWRAVHEPGVYAPHEVPPLPGGEWHARGSGFAAYGGVLRERYAGQLASIDGEAYAHARKVALLSVPRFTAGAGESADLAAPLYVRDKVALTVNER
jgi:tRNA threonylcarbamoyladenosine biosynthesis protein TsaB